MNVGFGNRRTFEIFSVSNNVRLIYRLIDWIWAVGKIECVQIALIECGRVHWHLAYAIPLNTSKYCEKYGLRCQSHSRTRSLVHLKLGWRFAQIHWRWHELTLRLTSALTSNFVLHKWHKVRAAHSHLQQQCYCFGIWHFTHYDNEHKFAAHHQINRIQLNMCYLCADDVTLLSDNAENIRFSLGNVTTIAEQLHFCKLYHSILANRLSFQFDVRIEPIAFDIVTSAWFSLGFIYERRFRTAKRTRYYECRRNLVCLVYFQND